MRKKRLVSVLILGSVLMLPLFASAATIEEMQKQIGELMKQITSLQEKIQQQKGDAGTASTDTSTSTSTSATKPGEGGRWCYNFNRSLKVGMSGADVSALQASLEKEGFTVSDSEKSGYVYGTSTAAAVEKFQEKNKTSVTGYSDPSARGVFGPQTRKAMGSVYGCGQGATPVRGTSVVCAKEGESLRNPSLGPNSYANNDRPTSCCAGLQAVYPGGTTRETMIVGAAAVCKRFEPSPAPITQTCGGIAGKLCPAGTTCKLDGTYPDAGGVCVASTATSTPTTKVCPAIVEQLLQCKTTEKVEYTRDDGGCFVSKRCVPLIQTSPQCGGIAGKVCPAGTTCKLDGTYPDAGGVCVYSTSTGTSTTGTGTSSNTGIGGGIATTSSSLYRTNY